MIFARTSAGRMIFFRIMSGVTGVFPSFRTDGKRKSSSPLYGDSFLQISRHSMTDVCNGTGLRLASVLVSPKRPRTHERMTLTLHEKRIDISPCESHQFRAPQPGTSCQDHHSLYTKR